MPFYAPIIQYKSHFLALLKQCRKSDVTSFLFYLSYYTLLILQPGFFCLGFSPVVDGTLLTKHPEYLRQEGSFEPVPTIIGQTSDDGSYYTTPCRPRTTLIRNRIMLICQLMFSVYIYILISV